MSRRIEDYTRTTQDFIDKTRQTLTFQDTSVFLGKSNTITTRKLPRLTTTDGSFTYILDKRFGRGSDNEIVVDIAQVGPFVDHAINHLSMWATLDQAHDVVSYGHLTYFKPHNGEIYSLQYEPSPKRPDFGELNRVTQLGQRDTIFVGYWHNKEPRTNVVYGNQDLSDAEIAKLLEETNTPNEINLPAVFEHYMFGEFGDEGTITGDQIHQNPFGPFFE